MKKSLTALAVAAALPLLAGCPSNGGSTNDGGARDVRLVELKQQFQCHIGAMNAHQDIGAIVEPKGVDSAAKLGHVSYQQAVALADKFDVIYWCAL